MSVAKKQVSTATDRGVLEVLTWRGTEQDLLDLARQGSPQFAARFYDRYAPDVNRVIFKLLGPDEEHDDLVHDTFMRAIRYVHQVREPERLGSWVVAVAVHTVYRELKRRRRFRFWTRERVLDLESRHEPAADHESRELLVRVYAVLDALSVEQRQVFALRHLDEKSLGEIAELMGCSLSSVKRHLTKAEERFWLLAGRRYPDLVDLYRARASREEEA